MDGKKNNLRRGSLTIESAIILPFVIYIFVTMIYVSRIYTIYNKVENVTYNIAMDVSNAGYMLQEVGLLSVADKAAKDVKKVNLQGNLNSFSGKLTSLIKATDDGAIIQIGEALKKLAQSNSAQSLVANVNNVKVKSESFLVLVHRTVSSFMNIISQLNNYENLVDIGLKEGSEILFESVGKMYVSYKLDEIFTAKVKQDYFIASEKFDLTGSSFYTDLKTIDNRLDDDYESVRAVSCIKVSYNLDIPFPIPDIFKKEIELTNSVVIRGYAGELQ